MTYLLWCNRPDGKKKAYVRLTADHDALEVANKVSFLDLWGISGLTQIKDWLHLMLFRFPRIIRHGVDSGRIALVNGLMQISLHTRW